MIHYDYSFCSAPNLDKLESELLASSISSTYVYFRWDKEDEYLKIFLTRELNASEKEFLDYLVATL